MCKPGEPCFPQDAESIGKLSLMDKYEIAERAFILAGLDLAELKSQGVPEDDPRVTKLKRVQEAATKLGSSLPLGLLLKVGAQLHAQEHAAVNL